MGPPGRGVGGNEKMLFRPYEITLMRSVLDEAVIILPKI
jgi:hypothetical protein